MDGRLLTLTFSNVMETDMTQTKLHRPNDSDLEDSRFIAQWAMDPSLLRWPGIAIDGPVLIRYDQHWGDNPVSVTVTNPTYMDLWRAANELILKSGDTHHVFVENFVHDSKYNSWLLSTGS